VANDSSGAFNDALRFQDPIYYYGVVLSMPLNNVRERNDYRASKAQREIAELQLKKAEQAVMVLVADWVNRVQSRYTRVSSTRAARQFAEAALRNEERKLQNGLSTSFFVLELQEKLITAQNAEIQAIADYNKALAHLGFAEARSLNRHGITLQF
jgi:outer membrane protein TolC